MIGNATPVGCQVVHTNISACSTFLLWCTIVYLATLPPHWLKNRSGATKWGHVDTPQVFDHGPHVLDVSPNVDVGRLQVMTISQSHHIGWIMMAHHESHCGRLIHQQKNCTFSFVWSWHQATPPIQTHPPHLEIVTWFKYMFYLIANTMPMLKSLIAPWQ